MVRFEPVLPGWIRFLPDFTGFYWVSISFFQGSKGFYRVLLGSFRILLGHFYVLLSFPGFFMVQLRSSVFHWVSLGFLGFTGLY